MQVIFMRGIPASGKTTYAKAWAEEDPEHRIRISWDDIRRMYGKYWVPNRENLVQQLSLKALVLAMNAGYDVIVDNMNLSDKNIQPFIEIIDKHAEIKYVDLKTPLDVCIERDSKRENPIGEDVIRNVYLKHKEFYT